MNNITPKKIKDKSNSYSKKKQSSKNVKKSSKKKHNRTSSSKITKTKYLSLKSLSLNPDNKHIYEICEGIDKILSEIISKNKNLCSYENILSKQKDNIFSLKKIPKITITNFLRRIIAYADIECSTLFLSIVYLHKILEKCLFLTEYNVHKLLSISILIAIKYNEDKISNNTYYGKVFGLTIKDVNFLEYSYLQLLDFNVFIKHRHIKKFFDFLYQKIFVGVNNP